MSRIIKYGLYFGFYGPLFGNFIVCVGWVGMTCFAESCTDPSVYKMVFGMSFLGLFFCHFLGGIPAILTGIAVGLFARRGISEIAFTGATGFLFTLSAYDFAIEAATNANALLFGLVGALAGLLTIWLRNKFEHLAEPVAIS